VVFQGWLHQNQAEPWRVTLVDTGEGTMTGGRLKRVAKYLDDEDFCLRYGDGVGDVDITRLLEFHRDSGRMVTITAVQPPGQFGDLVMDGDRVPQFAEKTPGDGGWISGGFFVLSPEVLDYVEGGQTYWEREPLERLAAQSQLAAYKHTGFWQPMDTLRDRNQLNALWDDGQAPWRIW